MTETTVQLSTLLRDCVGGKTATAFEKAFGMTTVLELLVHIPRRYQERGELTDLSRLRIDDHVTVVARVKSATTRRMRNNKQMLEVIVTDGNSDLSLTFFGQAWRERDMRPNRLGLFAGKVGEFRGKKQLSHPDFEFLDDNVDVESVGQWASAILPVYPASATVASWKIANAVRFVLPLVDWTCEPDSLPPELRKRYDLPELGAAFWAIHLPSSIAQAMAARRRLKWEEALALQVVLAVRRRKLGSAPATARVGQDDGLLAQFDAKLPFTLTNGQVEVSDRIFAELASGHPMHRLLQGEVGSGKTLVALRAMLAVIDAGGQAVLLAPTEVLAAQHLRTIKDLMGPLATAGMLGGDSQGTEVTLITGSQSAPARREALLKAASGQAGIVIGTHALLEDNVQFADLGLIVVDEQHRFGVEQRAALNVKARAGTRAHVLVMTATPIPRTVAITVFGDLEVSTLRELPAGRVPIQTHVVPAREKPTHLARTWERVREEVGAGRAVYIVCPRIDQGPESDFEGAPQDFLDDELTRIPPASIEKTFNDLSCGPLAGLRLAEMTGRMSGEAKDSVMRRFAAPRYDPDAVDVLIATTVIEVGVDVANATVMVVLDAERFGISQLHQLRGRVGRGAHPGLCLLVTNSEAGSPARKRCEAVASTNDGFELSRLDLAARREGNVLGASQSGRTSSLRYLSLVRDEEIIVAARAEADAIIDNDPYLLLHNALRELATQLVGDEGADWLERT